MIDTAGAHRFANNLCRNRLIVGHLLYKKWGARGLRLRCLSIYSQVMKSLLASNVLIPIPRTFIMSSGFSKGPFCCL